MGLIDFIVAIFNHDIFSSFLSGLKAVHFKFQKIKPGIKAFIVNE